MAAVKSLLASFVLAALAAQAMVESRTAPAAADAVKKPDCVPGVDPRTFPGIVGGGHGGGITPVPSHGTPSHGSSSGSTPSPSHGGSSGSYGTPPSHGSSSGSSPSPSHGGGGSVDPTPSAPSGGGAYGGGSSPAAPSHGSSGGAYGGGSSPAAPSHGSSGGAYGSSPATPSHGGGAYGSGSPATPSQGTTTTPMPFTPLVDPHSTSTLPGSCDYWRSHPMEIWSAIGGRMPSSMGQFFGGGGAAGVGASTPGMSIQDALANTMPGGSGALLREGAAALLNSMTRSGFPYTTQQVRDAFAAAAAGGSDGAAAAQAAAFKKANEGRA